MHTYLICTRKIQEANIEPPMWYQNNGAQCYYYTTVVSLKFSFEGQLPGPMRARSHVANHMVQILALAAYKTSWACAHLYPKFIQDGKMNEKGLQCK